MSRDKTIAQYPLRIFFVRMSVYNGQVNCLVKETFARLRGSYLQTADGVRYQATSVLSVNRGCDDPELERYVICDDENRIEDAIHLLEQSLREDALRKVEEAKKMYALICDSEIVITRRNFTD